MNTFIYKSSSKDGLYLYITKKDDFSDIPQTLYDSMGKEPLFVMEIMLSEDKPLAREDVSKVIKNLQSQGFHVQIPPPALNLTTFKAPANYVN
jgi:uncharacterized protein YcgL (UPF0745 family)